MISFVHKTVWSKLFWISQPEAETQVIKVELRCYIWQNFTLVTIQSCAVNMEMYRDSVIALLHNAKSQAASHCCQYKLGPKYSPIKTKPHPHRSKWWTAKIFWAISNKLLSFWNLKIAFVDLEILEKRYITIMAFVILVWRWNWLSTFALFVFSAFSLLVEFP